MTPRNSLRLAAFLPCSRANGPGLRSVVWVQGCALRCPGCFNPDFLPLAGGTPHDPAEIAGMILSATATEGVTFSGGEPFLQAAALAEIARLVRETDRSVIIFTGFEWDELEHSADPDHQALLVQADTLIAGPYRCEEASSHPLLASGNQRMIHLSGRYKDEDFLTLGAKPAARRVEFRIAPDGTVAMTGFPSQAIQLAMKSKVSRQARKGRQDSINQIF